MMVAFEKHANQMINSLWNSLASIHGLEKNSLQYFETHVGGDDPAEAYHVRMTQRLVTSVVPKEEQDRFFSHFLDCYDLNYKWCAAICKDVQTDPFIRSSEEFKKDGLWTSV